MVYVKISMEYRVFILITVKVQQDKKMIYLIVLIKKNNVIFYINGLLVSTAVQENTIIILYNTEETLVLKSITKDGLLQHLNIQNLDQYLIKIALVFITYLI